MSGIQSDCLFVIIPELYSPDRGYELSTIWPGVSGVHGTNFYCGYDLELAIEWANDLNKQRGHDPDFTTQALEISSGLNNVHFFNV